MVEGSSRRVRLCPLWLGCACLQGGGPLCFWHYGSSHLFMGLLCSSCEDLHSTSFRELVSTGGRRSSLYALYPGGHLSSWTGEICFSFSQRAPPSFVAVVFLELRREAWDLFRVATGNLRKPLMLPQLRGSFWNSFQVAAGE